MSTETTVVEKPQPKSVAKLAEAEAQQKRDAAQAYDDLIWSVFENDEIGDEKKTLGILHSAGKTAEDLSRDVHELRRRRDQLEQVSRIPELREEAAAIRAQMDKQQAAWDLAQKKHTASMRDLRSQQSLRHDDLSQLQKIRGELLAARPEQFATLQQLQVDRSGLTTKHRQCDDALRLVEAHLRQATHNTNYMDRRGVPNEKRVQSLEQKRDKGKEELQQLDMQIKQVGAQMEDLEKRMLVLK